LGSKEDIVKTEKRYKKLFNESPVMMAVVNSKQGGYFYRMQQKSSQVFQDKEK